MSRSVIAGLVVLGLSCVGVGLFVGLRTQTTSLTLLGHPVQETRYCGSVLAPRSEFKPFSTVVSGYHSLPPTISLKDGCPAARSGSLVLTILSFVAAVLLLGCAAVSGVRRRVARQRLA